MTDLTPEQYFEILFYDVIRSLPLISEAEYDAVLRTVSEIMGEM
jgi:hypothetical protein